MRYVGRLPGKNKETRCELGTWPNALLYRRCALGLLDYAYSFDPPDAHVERIPNRARSELLSLLALSPLFWTNLRAQVSTGLRATDASVTWCAAVTSQIAVRTAEELWRLRDERPRSYVRCETEMESLLRRAWNEGEPDEQIAVALALFGRLECEKWRRKRENVMLQRKWKFNIRKLVDNARK